MNLMKSPSLRLSQHLFSPQHVERPRRDFAYRVVVVIDLHSNQYPSGSRIRKSKSSTITASKRGFVQVGRKLQETTGSSARWPICAGKRVN